MRRKQTRPSFLQEPLSSRSAAAHIKALLLLLLATPALAQVSTDDKALDQLAPAPATQPAKPATPRAVPRKRTAPAAARLTPPRMPAAPPLHPVIQPPAFTMPAHPPAPPPPVSVVAGAPGVATPIQGGTRITFGAGGSDLNPMTLAAVQAIAARAIANPAIIIDVTAWAPGTADDPSTARRLSLDRALAARAVMIQAGVVSDRIRTVARGSLDTGTVPADRADVVVEAAAKK